VTWVRVEYLSDDAGEQLRAAERRWRDSTTDEDALEAADLAERGFEQQDAVARELSSLPDSWMLLRGYRNRRGGVDAVLVGPSGVWAVAVKRRPVRLHAIGDDWWYENTDRCGNVVESGWATDGGRRSWPRQVNEVAADLAGWLRRNGQQVSIRTAVLLIHESAAIGQREQLTVSLVTTDPQQLLTQIEAQRERLSAEARRRIVDLIRRDHQSYE
jgi:hypothetical protein